MRGPLFRAGSKLLLAAVVGLLLPAASQAWIRVGIGIGIPIAPYPYYGPYYRPYYYPPAVVVQPATVIVQPAPASVYVPAPTGPTNVQPSGVQPTSAQPIVPASQPALGPPPSPVGR
jgi:hypothetical protein